MKFPKVILLAGIALAIALAVLIQVRDSGRKREQQRESPPDNRKDAEASQPVGGGQVPKLAPPEILGSDSEIKMMRVTLPPPSNEPWEGPFFNSRTCFEAKHASACVSVLPVWILKAVRAGDQDKAAGYLGTLIRLVGHPDPEVSAEAALALYRLGDSGDVAFNALLAILRNGSSLQLQDPTGKGVLGNYHSLQQVILSHADFYQDKRFVEPVRQIWQDLREGGTEQPDTVDFAYYLASHGIDLGKDYWFARLDSRKGLEATLDTLNRTRPPGTAEALQGAYDRLADYRQSVASVNIAASFYQVSGNKEALDYLFTVARAGSGAGAPLPGFSKAIATALAADPGKAAPLLKQALENSNDVIRETALAAIPQSGYPEAIPLLRDEALITAGKRRFPSRELRALLNVGSPEAIREFTALKKQLLDPPLGWTANDFGELDFLKNQMSH